MNPTLTLNHNAPIVVDSFAGGGMVLEFRQGWLQADLELAEERAK